MRTEEDRFWSKVDKSGPCWLWTASKDPSGYGLFHTFGGIVRSHRWSYAYYIDHVPDAIEQTCDNRHCVRPSHMRPGKRGRKSKLAPEQIKKIKLSPMSCKSFALLYGVSHMTISKSRGLKNLYSGPLEGQFWSRVSINGVNDCWHFRGSPRFQGIPVHVWAFRQAFNSEVATVHHVCDNRLCVNPAHLGEGPGIAKKSLRERAHHIVRDIKKQYG